jgi:hypothetical protein
MNKICAHGLKWTVVGRWSESDHDPDSGDSGEGVEIAMHRPHCQAPPSHLDSASPFSRTVAFSLQKQSSALFLPNSYPVWKLANASEATGYKECSDKIGRFFTAVDSLTEKVTKLKTREIKKQHATNTKHTHRRKNAKRNMHIPHRSHFHQLRSLALLFLPVTDVYIDRQERTTKAEY